MNRIRYSLLGTILLATLLVSLPVAARSHLYQGDEPQKHHRQELSRNDGMSLDRAVAEVRARTGGRVLAASTRFIDGRPVHVIRVLTQDGRVRTYWIDAQTGRRIR